MRNLGAEFEFVRETLGEYRETIRQKIGRHSSTANKSTLVQKSENQRANFVRSSDAKRERNLQAETPNVVEMNRKLSDYLYQGDTALTVEQTQLMFPTRQARQSIDGVRFPDYKWSRNISYSFAPYYYGKVLSLRTIAIVREALNFWQAHTCLAFDERRVGAPRAQLAFFQGYGCWSYVGAALSQSPTGQPISIGYGCEDMGIVAHEIGHALGFFHTQSRHDRDAFVRFVKQNVENGLEDQFRKEPPTRNNNYGVPYDYGSIMHYSDESGANAAGRPVLVALQPLHQNTMGQQFQPSFSDVLIMNRHYGCLADCAKSETKCENGGYPHPKNCAVCICAWGFGGAACTERQTSSQLSDDNYGETVNATLKWTKLDATLTAKSEDLKMQHVSCHFHIKAPKNRKIHLRLLQIGGECSPGCFNGNAEFKVGDDFTQSGYRMCCARAARDQQTLITKTNLAAISIYAKRGTHGFSIQYRYL